MPRPPALPAATPRTTTQLLLARGGDPYAQTHAILSSALQSVSELLGFLPPEQKALRSRFQEIHALLDAAWPTLPTQQGAGGPNPQMLSSLGWGEPVVVSGAPVGREPVDPDAQAEPVYGFAAALDGTRRYLKETTDALRMGAQTWGAQRIVQAGAVAHAAAAIDHLAAVFTAAMWDFERPGMPTLPSKSGRIELRASPRPAPMTTWARYARAMFLTDRVELTTATGRRVIGDDNEIAFLLHVVPPSPTTTVIPYDPAEPYAPVPLYDELGVVHFCSADGHSMGAIAVADWLAQPELTVAQAADVQPSERLRAYDRLVWALEASGIAAGAATLRVPIRRGVQHPPHADPEVLSSAPRNRKGTAQLTLTPGAQPAPRSADVVRPGPHLMPYRGWAADPGRAFLRRQRRHKARQIDLGPASPATELLRALFPTTLWVGCFFTGYLLEGQWWVRLLVVLAFAAVLEPWISWLVRWLSDRDMRRMVATYRPGASTHTTRAFQLHAKLMYDGANIGIRTGSRHEAWLASGSDGDLGVVGLDRLTHNGEAWGFALVDRLGRWRLVLPADSWAPGDDLAGLAGFAQAADLQLGEQVAAPPTIRDDVMVEDSRFSTSRSHGPLTRGMVIVAIHALAAFVVTLPGSSTASIYTLSIAAIALVPVFLRWLWTVWYLGTPGAKAGTKTT